MRIHPWGTSTHFSALESPILPSRFTATVMQTWSPAAASTTNRGVSWMLEVPPVIWIWYRSVAPNPGSRQLKWTVWPLNEPEMSVTTGMSLPPDATRSDSTIAVMPSATTSADTAMTTPVIARGTRTGRVARLFDRTPGALTSRTVPTAEYSPG